MKKCSICLQNKTLSEFFRRRRSRDGYASQCKKCARKAQKLSIAKDPDKYMEKQYSALMKIRYGINREQYDRMLCDQNFSCKICLTHISDLPSKKTRTGRIVSARLNIDHCHQTGIIRGLLCSDCNTMLGSCKDNVGTLLAGVAYLQEAKGPYKYRHSDTSIGNMQ